MTYTQFILFLVFSIPVILAHTAGYYFTKLGLSERPELMRKSISWYTGATILLTGLLVLHTAGMADMMPLIRLLRWQPGTGVYFVSIAVLATVVVTIQSWSTTGIEKARTITTAQAMIFVLSALIYLPLYEMFFRGLLWVAFPEPVTKLWLLAVVNITLYSWVHSYEGNRMMLATIPFAIICNLLTWLTGNIWTALIAHLLLAIGNYFLPPLMLRIKLNDHRQWKRQNPSSIPSTSSK